MMSWLRDMINDPTGTLEKAMARYNNRTFLEATVAGCAIVAAADGKIDAAEKQKMMGFMRMSDALKVFDASEVVTLFQKSVEVFEFDHGVGKETALRVVAKLRGDDAAARMLIRVCCVIGGADGNFDDDEKKAVADICGALGLNPKEFL